MSKTSSTGNVINIKTGLAEMLKGGVIMDVVTPEQARVAEDAGAIAVMALERVPSDIRKAGGVARMSPPELIEAIKKEVSIPVMAKCRIGHFAEAQILEAIGVDYIDESEVLTPADDEFHVNKHDFKIPFVCGAKNLGEALRRIGEGAALIRSKGEPGTGNIVEAVRHMRQINYEMRAVAQADEAELMTMARDMAAPYELVRLVKELGRLPVPLFSAGGIATPADASLCMQLGAESVFVGSGIFKSDNPEKFARAIVKATAHYDDPKIVLEASKELEGVAMRGTEISEIDEPMLMANRGW
ncbi:MAG: pyridoxal 5'-phosphate synthase lyase subunit PdxS [Alphaproteobacteria bacterium]|nr:pyridoxal 5'-phosphate synthase lyase subunit PdxS [Alphaproteobacteria bacterium]MCD8526071.1 pyridoxal 5'-phosphate synthase lyase subunit PdxS [Alphaproteobacteria bacterium]